MADGLPPLMGPLGEAARELIVRAFGPAADEIGAMLSNEMKVWKASRLQRLAELWRQKMAGKAIPVEAIQQLPFGSIYRVLDAASTEDSDDVLDMWAGLIANAMDPSSPVELSKAYETILANISSGEVLLLRAAELASSRPHVLATNEDAQLLIARLASVPQVTRQVAYENLRRLGCVLPVDASRQLGFSMGRLPGARENVASAAGVAAALDAVIKLQRMSSGATEYDPVEFSAGLPTMTVTFQLTQLGKHLLAACTMRPAASS